MYANLKNRMYLQHFIQFITMLPTWQPESQDATPPAATAWSSAGCHLVGKDGMLVYILHLPTFPCAIPFIMTHNKCLYFFNNNLNETCFNILENKPY
jgi:hypothetical protein